MESRQNGIRTTTDHRHHPIDFCSPKKRTMRHRDDFALGDRLGRRVADFLGCSDSTGRAIVTFTTFEVMGRDAHNDNGTALRSQDYRKQYGQQRWVKTTARTYGFLPIDQQTLNARWQCNGNSEWAWSDSFAGADLILGAFGLTMRDVLDHYGNVDPYERKIFDLPSILRDLGRA